MNSSSHLKKSKSLSSEVGRVVFFKPTSLLEVKGFPATLLSEAFHCFMLTVNFILLPSDLMKLVLLITDYLVPRPV